MRINVYAEELTTECEVVTKVVTDDEFGTRTFYGIRHYLHSPDVLHHSKDDDDRSAITYWVEWKREYGHNFNTLDILFDNLTLQLDLAKRDDDEKTSRVEH